MFISNFISSVKSRLAVKSILVVAIFISAVSLLFTVFFMTYQKRLLTGELYKRAHALARNLAYNSRDFISIVDTPVIQSLVSGVQEEPDIVNVFLTDHDGTVLTSTDTTHTDETFTFPARHDSTGRINWYPIDDDMTMRMILPVEIKALIIESDTLLYPPKETIGYAVLDISMENLNHAIAVGNRIAIIIAFSFTGTAILCVFLLMRSIVRPVKNIARSAEKIARGNLYQKLSTRRKDEIGVLADSLNNMIIRLNVKNQPNLSDS